MEKMIGKVQKLLISESPLLLNHSAMLSSNVGYENNVDNKTK